MQATTVAARGEAETDYNLAGFSVSLDAEAQAVPAAKARLKKKVDELTAALEKMKADLELEFVKDSVRANSNVQEKHQWNQKKNENEFMGYVANYSFSFQIDDMEKVSKVYDVLTSLDEVTVSSPGYGLKDRDREKLNKKALKHAFAKVTDRFEMECKVFDLSPADFEVASWEVTYSDSQRSSRVSAHTRRVGAMRARNASNSGDLEVATAYAAAAPAGGAAPADEPIELVVGKAVVTVNLEVGYARRVSQTVKAQVVRSASNGAESSRESDHV